MENLQEIQSIEDRLKLTKIPDDFENFLKNCKESKMIPYVILNTGSYCPLHKKHVESLIKAKDFLERNFNIRVLAIYLSPSHDDYVYDKAVRYGFAKYHISFEKRCELIENALIEHELEVKNQQKLQNNIQSGNQKPKKEENSYFKDYLCPVKLDKWEGTRNQFIDFPRVWISTQIYFNEIWKRYNFEKNTIKVALCVGSDMLKTYIDKKHDSLRYGKDIFSLPLIVNRRKNCPYAMKYVKYTIEDMKKNELFFVNDNEVDNATSSTIIRNLIENKKFDELKKYVYESTYEYYKGKST